MENNKAAIVETLTASFSALSAPKIKGQGSGKYTPDPVEIAAMARRIAAKTRQDPTRLASQTINDLLGY